MVDQREPRIQEWNQALKRGMQDLISLLDDDLWNLVWLFLSGVCAPTAIDGQDLGLTDQRSAEARRQEWNAVDAACKAINAPLHQRCHGPFV
ncbi:hypothetical protein D3C81_1757740 [compost metagenome]